MKSKLFTLLIATILTCTNSFSQDVELSWSEPILYSSSKGQFSKFISKSDKYSYTSWTQLKSNSWWEFKKIKIYAIDNQTNKQVAELGLFGYEENKALKKTYKELTYIETIVIDDVVVVLWKNGTRVFGETFDEKLNRTSDLKLMHEYTNIPKCHKRAINTVLVNHKYKKILFCTELSGIKGDTVRVNLKLFSNNLKEEKEFQVKLPILLYQSLGDLYSMLFKDDLSLHFQADPNRLPGKKSQFSRLPTNCSRPILQMFGSINLRTKKVTCKSLELPKLNVGTHKLTINENGIFLYGLTASVKNNVFKELKKYTGTFFIRMDKEYNVLSKNTKKFTSSDISQLFNDSPYSKDQIMDHKIMHPDFLTSEYRIETSKIDENGDLFLFLSRNHVKHGSSYENASLGSSKGSISTFVNIKSDVLIIKFNSLGEYKWMKNIPRRKLYTKTISHTNFRSPNPTMPRPDIFVLEKDQSLIVLTADDYNINENGSAKRKKKKEIRKKQPIRIFNINKETGNFSSSEIQINKTKEEKKKVYYWEKILMSNKLFMHSYQGKKEKVGLVGVIKIKE